MAGHEVDAESRKMEAHDVFDTFATHFGLGHDVIDTDC